jgi:hypothetical protein
LDWCMYTCAFLWIGVCFLGGACMCINTIAVIPHSNNNLYVKAHIKHNNRTVAFTLAPRLAPLLLPPNNSTPTTITLTYDDGSAALLHIHMSQPQQPQQKPHNPLLSLRPGQSPANRGLLFPVSSNNTPPDAATDGSLGVRHPLARRGMEAVLRWMPEGEGGRLMGRYVCMCLS